MGGDEASPTSYKNAFLHVRRRVLSCAHARFVLKTGRLLDISGTGIHTKLVERTSHIFRAIRYKSTPIY